MWNLQEAQPLQAEMFSHGSQNTRDGNRMNGVQIMVKY